MLRFSIPAFALLLAATSPQQTVVRAPSDLPATLFSLAGLPSDAFQIADDAPFVRLFNVFALPFGFDPKPVTLDEAQIDRRTAMIDRVGNRMRGAGVRVANLSWGITAEEITQSLIDAGEEPDRDRAVARGRALFEKADAALRRMIAASPNILFVTGAGNSNQTDRIHAASPQSIAAPNLLVVGAAGIDGRMTSFSTYGDSVAFYAWGEGVPVRTPGGGVRTARARRRPRRLSSAPRHRCSRLTRVYRRRSLRRG